MRSCAYGRYLVLFRVLDAEVRVERILHGSRDIIGMFTEADSTPQDLLNQQVTDQVHVFEQPFKSRCITVSQISTQEWNATPVTWRLLYAPLMLCL